MNQGVSLYILNYYKSKVSIRDGLYNSGADFLQAYHDIVQFFQAAYVH